MSQKNNKQPDRHGRNLKSMVIEPFKQVKFGLYVIAISATFVILAGGLFVLAFSQQYQHVMELFQVVDSDMKWELVVNDVFATNAWRLAALFVCFLATMMFVVFKLTHKYYGPLVSVERFVEQIGSGSYSSRVQVRNGDELDRLVAKLNHMASQLQARHGHTVGEDGKEIDRRSLERDSDAGKAS